MMKTHGRFKIKRILAALLSMVMLCGNVTITTQAETQTTAVPLKPADLEYEDGNIVLHKQAERIAADEWKINVKATIKEQKVEPPKMEVVFVLDLSKSMKSCAEENLHALGYHSFHNSIVCPLVCENSSHEHQDECFACGKVNQLHIQDGTCSYEKDGSWKEFPSRLSIAKDVIARMESSLPEGTKIGRVVFNSKVYQADWDGKKELTFSGDGTYLMDGVHYALNEETPYYSDDPTTKKILIIVTD
ncbi:MAG: hypothetical protein IKL38_01910, partial [Firmicutes bacterium]|nr:hypothetical protein [Bacillota bacterium]